MSAVERAVSSSIEDKAEQEVSFWRSYIRWWERQYGIPASPRMYEALVSAERRAASLARRDGVSHRTTIH